MYELEEIMPETLTKPKTANQEIGVDTQVLVSGHVRIENGDTVIEGKNKITKHFLLSLINFISGHTFTDNAGPLNRNWNNTAYTWVYLGTDTTTPTNASTGSLVAPIGPTKCSTISTTSWQTGNACYVQWNATFNPGTVSGTVGEMGIYLYCKGDSLNAAGSTYTNNASQMLARYAVADSEFSTFSIDTTKPVVVVWTFKFETDLKILNQGVYTIANFVAGTEETVNLWCPCVNWTQHNPSSYSGMVIGSDTTTNNTATMTALVSPIGSGVGTAANTASFSTYEAAVGDYRLYLTSVWNAGTVSGTVGEIGLYLAGHTTYTGTTTMPSFTSKFWARLSHADGHFTSFSIDTGKNLTITWQIRFLFS